MTDTYADSDFVYVDPATKQVVGKVEWTKDGLPKEKKYVEPVIASEKKKKDEQRKPSRRKLYPWGSYRSMKRIYRLEGKVKEAESNETLDQVLPKALESAFW